MSRSRWCRSLERRTCRRNVGGNSIIETHISLLPSNGAVRGPGVCRSAVSAVRQMHAYLGFVWGGRKVPLEAVIIAVGAAGRRDGSSGSVGGGGHDGHGMLQAELAVARGDGFPAAIGGALHADQKSRL